MAEREHKEGSAIGSVQQQKTRLAIWRPVYEWPLCLLMTLGAALGFIAVFGMRYEVNDDAIISNIAAGAYGPDTQYLVYVNLLLGYLLKPFFALAPGLNWFVILLFLGGLACFTVLGVLLLRGGSPLAGSALFAALLLCAGSEFFVYFHYSRYAGLFLVTGFLLLYCHLGHWNRGTFAGMLLVLLGSMLRFQMFFAVGALSVFLLGSRFLSLEPGKRKKAMVAAAILLGLVFGCKGVDAVAYQTDAGWASYQELNRVRTEISDFRMQFFSAEADADLSGSYSPSDIEMLQNWSYYDDEVFPVEELQQFSSALPLNSLSGTLADTAATMVKMLYSTPLHLLFGAFIAAWLFLLGRPKWKPLCGTLLVLLAEVGFLSWRGRLPERIDFVLVFSALCLCACLAGLFSPRPASNRQQEESAAKAPSKPYGPKVALFAFTLLLFACVPFLQAQYTQSRDYWESRPPRAAEIDALAEDKEHLYLLDSYLVDAANGYDVWHTRPAGYFSNLVFVGSWLMGSPFQEDTLHRYGLENPYRDAVGREEVLLADFYYRELKEDYLREHYGPGINLPLAE
ncbi:hypothetical protein LJC49_08070, partial [Ruminococcaceae bacterium OttesenSCG-928-I18]|nr:hypothetical protein [Ruminococcaceae bacterium OttesenSCG-928-I18]